MSPCSRIEGHAPLVVRGNRIDVDGDGLVPAGSVPVDLDTGERRPVRVCRHCGALYVDLSGLALAEVGPAS